MYLVPGGTSGEYDVSAAPSIIEGEYFGVGALVAGDIDGDGISDLMGDEYDSATGTYYVSVLLGPPPSGTTTTASEDARLITPYSTGRLAVGDIDGDGDNDILAVGPATYGAAYALFNVPSGEVDVEADADWSASLASAAIADWVGHDGGGGQVTGVDFDGDGFGEVLIAEESDSGQDRVCGWYGPLAGGASDCDAADFRYFVAGEMHSLGSIVIGIDDVSGDGVPELLVTEPMNDEEGGAAGAAYLLSLGAL